MEPIMLEQRRYERFNIALETRALAYGKIAQVMDISKGGLSLLFLDDTTSTITGELSFDLLCNGKGVDARQIPGKIVWNKEISFSAIPGMVYKKVGVQFGDLSSTQQRLLWTLLLTCDTMSA
jgi:PilZ domain